MWWDMKFGVKLSGVRSPYATVRSHYTKIVQSGNNRELQMSCLPRNVGRCEDEVKSRNEAHHVILLVRGEDMWFAEASWQSGCPIWAVFGRRPTPVSVIWLLCWKIFLFFMLYVTGAGTAQWHSAGLRAGWWGVRIPIGAGNFSPHHRVPIGSGAHHASYATGNRGFSLGVKRPGCETDHSSPSSAEVKNEWSYTSTPPVRLHGVVLS
jgi:hypothetical protein